MHKMIYQLRYFVVLIIIAGFMKLCQTWVDNDWLEALFFTMNYLCFCIFLFMWIQSLKVRLLPTRVRHYMVVSALLMLLLLTLRIFKYRFVGENVILMRYLGYGYLIPEILITGIFFMISLRTIWGDERYPYFEWFIHLMELLLMILVMTNDLHHLVYKPDIPLSRWVLTSGTYHYGVGMYMIIGWMFVCGITGFVLLSIKTGQKSMKWVFLLTMTIVSWLFWVLFTVNVIDIYHILNMYNVPELHVIHMAFILEICIQARLIPYNANIVDYFEQLQLKVMITDRSFRPCYMTSKTFTATQEQLQQACLKPYNLSQDLKLSGQEIQAGYVFWCEDESQLHTLKKKLEEANEVLSEENSLIAQENYLALKQAQLDAHKAIYDRIAHVLQPELEKQKKLLDSMDSTSSTFIEDLARCCVMNAYIKRKSNLLLMNSKTLPRRNRELFLALEETSRYLQCCHIQALATGDSYCDFPLDTIHALYDCFEAIIEAYLSYLTIITISLNQHGIRLAFQATKYIELTNLPLPIQEQDQDNIHYITIYRGN